MKGTAIATLIISAVVVIAFAIVIGIMMYGKNKAPTDAPQQQQQPTPAPEKAEQPTPPVTTEQPESNQ